MFLNTSIRRVLLTAFVGSVGAAHAADIAGPAADREITRQVKHLIAQRPDLGTTLTVRTKNGVVYLGGTTLNIFAQVNAEGVAEKVTGVKGVVDFSGVND